MSRWLQRDAPGAAVRWVTGFGCLLLSVTNLLSAIGPAEDTALLAPLAEAGPEFLFQSAACYAFCGTLLLRGRG